MYIDLQGGVQSRNDRGKNLYCIFTREETLYNAFISLHEQWNSSKELIPNTKIRGGDFLSIKRLKWKTELECTFSTRTKGRPSVPY